MIKQNNKIYDELYSEGWIDGWEDRDKRHNFYYLFKLENYCQCSLINSSILDVGCGSGDMVKYLPKQSKYLGIDIYKPALNLAKEKYPVNKFKYGNVLTFKQQSKKFDYVFCSGALSVNHGNNYEFLQKAVENMWELCDKGIAFNILTGKNLTEEDELFDYDIKKVKKICKKIIKKEGKYFQEHNPIDKYNDQHTIYLCKN
jgi:ubiquinone/menaquinone biosynthesis C-methylase UbiE